eukprot:2039189-Rhodomonas_salina.1
MRSYVNSALIDMIVTIGIPSIIQPCLRHTAAILFLGDGYDNINTCVQAARCPEKSRAEM